MLTVLLVDDEKWMRKTLRNSVDWTRHDMKIVFEAEDGEQAYDEIVRLKPDFVIADIEMPGMNGITLMRQVKEKGIQSLFIFISGYDRFEYAKAALNLGAIGYLLKPVDERELRDVLVKAKEQFLIANRELQKETEDLVRGFLQKDITDEKWQHFLHIHPYAATNRFVVISSEIDEIMSSQGDYADPMGLKPILAEEWKTQATKKGYVCLSVFTKLGVDLLLMPGSQRRDIEMDDLEVLCKRIAARFQEQSGRTISCGIGQAVSGISHIHNSSQESKKALEYKLIRGMETIVYFERLKTKAFSVELLDQALKVRIEDFLADGDRSSITLILNTIKSGIEERQASPQDVKLFIFSFIDLVVHSLPRRTALQSIQLDPNQWYEEICQCVGLESMLSKLKVLLENASFATAQQDADYYQKLVESIKIFIHRQYKEEISLDLVSQEFHFSPNYLSKIFKEETGESILDYTLRFRVQMARELLTEAQHNISEVATMVGYKDNPKYFTKVFKKIVGVTPVEYIGKKRVEN